MAASTAEKDGRIFRSGIVQGESRVHRVADRAFAIRKYRSFVTGRGGDRHGAGDCSVQRYRGPGTQIRKSWSEISTKRTPGPDCNQSTDNRNRGRDHMGRHWDITSRSPRPNPVNARTHSLTPCPAFGRHNTGRDRHGWTHSGSDLECRAQTCTRPGGRNSYGASYGSGPRGPLP